MSNRRALAKRRIRAARRRWPASWLARRWPRRVVFALVAAVLGLILNTASLAELSHTIGRALYRAGATSWSDQHTQQFPTALGLFTDAHPAAYFSDVAHYVTSRGISDVLYNFAWNNIQWKPHDKTLFNWRDIDRDLAAVPTDDTILGTLGPYALSWDATMTCDGAPCTGITDDLGSLLTGYDETDPANPSIPFNAWDMYVFQTVSRYGPSANGQGATFGQNRVHAWQILSEIDNSVYAEYGVDFSSSQLSQQGHNYGELLKRTAYVIHLADPTALINSEGLSDFDPNQLLLERSQLLPRSKLFVQAMAATGALSAIDGFGIHPYGAVPFDNGTELTRYLNSVGQYVEQLAGRRIPLWVTEVGFSSDAIMPSALCSPICETHADTLQRPSETKVMFQTLVELMACPYVQAVYWFQASTFYTSYAGVHRSTEVTYGLMTEHSGDAALIQSERGQTFYDFVARIFDQDYRVSQYTAFSGDVLFTFKNRTGYLTVMWSPGIFPLDTSKIAPSAFAALSFWHYKGFQIFPGHAPILLGEQPIYVLSSAPLVQSGQSLLLATPPAPTPTPTFAIPGVSVPGVLRDTANARDPREDTT